MAPKKSMKRSEAKGFEPAAKKAKADPNLAGIVEALEQAAGLPEGCRKMLLACMPHCFGTPGDKRHQSQEEAIKMIGEVITGVEAARRKAADDESAKVVEVEASRNGLQAAVAEAETVLAAAAKVVQVNSAAVDAATHGVQEAKHAVEAAQEVQRAGDASLLQTQQSKAALDAGIETDLQAIVEGQGEAEQHLQALLPLLSDLGLDESLMSALPSTCRKPATERGSFDAMVLEQLGTRMREQAAVLAKAVEEATPAAQERASAVEAAQAELGKADAAEKSAAEDLSAARVSHRAAAEGATATKERLEAFEPEYAKATQERDEKVEALENFRLYNITCFDMLRDQTSPAKVAEGGA